MFTIIGGDGKEYGPVKLQQVKNWIADGRANLDTKAKRIGDEEWKRLGDFPEINTPAPAEVSTAEPAIPDPSDGKGPLKVDPKTYADDLIERAIPLDIAGCFQRGWDLLKANFWPMVGAFAAIFLIMMLFSVVPIISLLTGLLLTGVFYGGLFGYYLKLARGESAELSDIFNGFSVAFVPLMLASIVSQVLTGVWVLLLILPGIYLAVAYLFVYILIMDKKLEFWAAMEVSRRVITAQWWRLLGLALIGVLLALLGAVALIIGMFVTIPIYMVALIYAYEYLCNPPRS